MSSPKRSRGVRKVAIPAVALILVAGLGALVKVSLPHLWDGSLSNALVKPPSEQPGQQRNHPDSRQNDDTSSAGAKVPAELSAAVDQRNEELGDLAKQAEKQNKLLSTPPVATFKVASFNILGNSHTSGKNPRKGFGGAGGRMAGAISMLRAHKIDVVGLQEIQPNQWRQFVGSAREYAIYPPRIVPFDSDNSIAYRRDMFELVEGGSGAYPYFGGARRNMPEILLRHKKTGVSFVFTSYHNPANVGGNNTSHRNRAAAMQAGKARARIAAKQPLIITGDMNDRASYFCAMVRGSAMHAANGGSGSGGCRPPGNMSIDWVMGSPLVEFSGYVEDRSSKGRRISDHSLIVAVAKVTGNPKDREQATHPDSTAAPAE